MIRLFLFGLRAVLRFKTIVASVLAGVAIAYGIQLREQHRTWGRVPAEVDRPLAGDDIVPNPGVVETRGIDIRATPAQVWPWLVQMGYGRGGWYSYDQLDRPWSPTGGPPGSSADEVLSEFQDLRVDDIVPTHPGGGFVARVVESERALVLYLDRELVRGQMEALAAESGGSADEATSAMTEMDMPDFQLSWAFVLEARPGGGARLIERFRLWMDDGGGPQRLGLPFVGYGVFALTRRQMLGIKERVEREVRRGD